MAEPLTSIIMPTYNHAQFIGEAVDSVLKQSFRNIELIIVDNYSEDNTRQIVESFNDDRIKYYKFPNKGIIAASRNFGIRKSIGQYAAFIDSDDVWFTDKLKQQIYVLERDGACQMVFCRFSVNQMNIQKSEKIMGPKNLKVNSFIYDELIRYNFIVSSSVLLRSKILKEVGHFDEAESLRCAEDFDLWLRIAHNNQVVFLPEILGMYRMHILNSNVNGQRLEKAVRVIDKHLKMELTTLKTAKRAKANFYFREGWFTIDSDTKLARSYFKKALKLNFYNLKILLLSVMGIGISYVPSLYKFIRRRNLDKNISRLFLNHQNL